MSSEDSTEAAPVPLVERFAEALARRDFAAAAGCFEPNGVYDASQAGVGTFAGRAAIGAFLADWLAAYEEWQNEWEEIGELSGGVVFSVNVQTGRPAGGQGSVRERYALTFSIGAAGLIARADIAQNVEDARAAAERLAAERS